jgi:hypothetical protein
MNFLRASGTALSGVAELYDRDAGMNRPTPQMRGLAKQLIVHSGPGNKISRETAPAFHVIDKLRPHLANLMGIGGFRALLARALVSAKAEVPWLNALQVKPDGTLEGLHSQINPVEFLEGRVVLVAQLLGLLVALIGPNVTSRLVSDVWPKFHSAEWASATQGDVS